jgi:hypothetical protein
MKSLIRLNGDFSIPLKLGCITKAEVLECRLDRKSKDSSKFHALRFHHEWLCRRSDRSLYQGPSNPQSVESALLVLPSLSFSISFCSHHAL